MALLSFSVKKVGRREFRGAFASFKALFSKFFGEILDAAKPVYKVLFFATEPSVCTIFVKKVTKKVLTLFGVRGIIYKSTRYGTEVPRSLDQMNLEN